MNDIKEAFVFSACIIALAGILLFAFMLPIAILDGCAKSSWLEKTQGVKIPWYQATFLKVEINDVDATLEHRNRVDLELLK